MITEQLMDHGSFELTLRDITPTVVTHAGLDLDTNMFGHIVVTTLRITDRPLTAAKIKALARYSGVYRRQEGPRLTHLQGTGLTFWLADEDGKDDKADTDVANYFGNLHFDVVFNGIIPVALTAGTVTDIVVGTGYQSLNRAGVNRKKVIDDACAYFVGEYRVNADFTVDAGPLATLWPTNTTPTSILLSRGSAIDGGRDINLLGMTASITPDIDVEDVGTYVVVVDSDGNAVGRFGGNHATLKDGRGNALRLRRIVQSTETQAASGDAAAQVQQARFTNPRQQLTVEVLDVYDLGLDVRVGDAVWMFAPDAGVMDAANLVYYRGHALAPAKARVMEVSWPIVEGMGVYFLPPTAAQTPIDLTEYVEFETGPTRVSVGAPSHRKPFVQGLPGIGVGVA